MKSVFIDGSSGTTGLRLKNRLEQRKDIKLINIDEKYRKDISYRKEAINKSDITILCLPDEASKEAIKLLDNDNTVIMDTSTAHRTNKDWVYGLPQLNNEQKEKIRTSKKIAIPGCHACGFISLVYPLVYNKIIDSEENISCFSITGYSGGGKSMIEEYEKENLDDLLKAPRLYALEQQHKHLKEMIYKTGLKNPPIFSPIVSNFYSGMQVVINLSKNQINKGFSIYDIINTYKNHYKDEVIQYKQEHNENGFLSTAYLSNKDSMQITLQGNEERFSLIARYDNLGKGASGSALECLNIVLGVEQTLGLEL